ncbi:MAG: hypothetical protein V2A55_00295 [Candidatus Jorgensenbacteria bacterium]
MAKTSKDARRHIRELSNFFSGVEEVTEELIDELIKNYKRKKYIKQSLKRMIDQGLIVKRNKKFSVTKEGKIFFRRYLSGSKNNKKTWDGKWYFVMFDVPVKFDRKRRILRSLLREYMFYPLQKSVWVSPQQLADDFWKRIVKNDLDRYCKILSTNILEGDEELKEYFKHFVDF